MIKNTKKYEYVNAVVRGQIGKLLTLNDYEAILGCSKSSDLLQVLNRSTYSEKLLKDQPQSFEAIDNIVSSVLRQNLTNLVTISPDKAKPYLNEYKLLLELRSVVNSLRSKINRDDVVDNAGANPLGSIPITYYKLPHKSIQEQFLKSPYDLKLYQIITESFQNSKNYNSTAPLNKVISYFCKIILDKNSEDSSSEWTSLEKLIKSIADAANLEIILTSFQHKINQQTVRTWLLNQTGHLSRDTLLTILNLGDIKKALEWLMTNRYKLCLELKSNFTISELLIKLPYCIMLQESRLTLAGYPFRPSIVAAGMTLKLLELRNLRLAMSGAMGKLNKVFALRMMTIP